MATFLLIIFLSLCLVGCGGDSRSVNTAAENATSVYQLNDKKYVIGYGEGSFAAHILRQELPNARPSHIMMRLQDMSPSDRARLTDICLSVQKCSWR